MLDIIQGLPEINNIDQILDLLTEQNNPILTEGNVNIILNNSLLSGNYNPDDHVVYLSYSKDGGVTYGYRQTATMGALGQRTHRTVWRKLGVVPRGQGFIPKIEFFSKVPFIILGAAWSFEMMPE